MTKNLVIVESPAKAKTIERFLGKDYMVRSCNGHVRDLAKKGMGIDIENDYTPTYVILPDKKKIITELKKASKDAEVVWLATDEDREGEAISWHLLEALNLNEEKVKRIAFHEITKPAILHAIETPRQIDKNLVDAQQARRVLDRLVGFNLSPVLWKKVRPALSAGRVQSVAVRLIVEREREISQFKTSNSYKVIAHFIAPSKDGKKVGFKAELSTRFNNKEEATQFLTQLIGATYKIENIEKKPAIQSPSAPFTTSTLQQEASRKLGFSVSQTMVLAQRLYEAGNITYMRTDSVNLSHTAIEGAKKEIIQRYGSEYANPRQYVTKTKSAQEAHEAIRPTTMSNPTIVSADNKESRLYDLIWKRTIASQMANAEIEKTVVTIQPSSTKDMFVATGEVIQFEGFLKVYLESKDEDESDNSLSDDENQRKMLPSVNIGQELNYEEINAFERYSKPPVRYSEASLVKKMENLGIGRPSTYAPTISTIQKRGYVVKENRQGTQRKFVVLSLQNNKIKEKEGSENIGFEKFKLFPTDIGIVVTDFLIDNFNSIMDYQFTATVEKEFDDVAQGQKKWNAMIGQFYEPFFKKVENAINTSERATGERILGEDPNTHKNVIVKIGRYGPVVQIGETSDDEKPKFASLKNGQSIEKITIEEALELFTLPRDVGMLDGKEIVIATGRYGPYIKYDNKNFTIGKQEDPYSLSQERAIDIIKENEPRVVGLFEELEMIASSGRFGPYIKHNNKFYSLSKQDNLFTIDEKRAIEIIKTKREANSNKEIKTFESNKSVQILNGRYGPYIKIGKKNYKIPKDKDPNELTLEECLLIEKNISNK